MVRNGKGTVFPNINIERGSLINFSIICFIATMPFSVKLNSIFLILLVVVWVNKKNLCRAYYHLKSRRLLQLFTAFYSLYLIGLLYSSNTKYALTEIVLKASILILPIIFSTIRLSPATIKFYLNTFVITCILAAMVSLIILFYKIVALEFYRAEDQLLGIDWVYFSYHLPKQIDFHPPYFSMYIVMSIFILTHLIYQNYKGQNKRYLTIVYSLGLLFLVCFAFSLSSRTSLASGVIILTISILLYLIRRKRIILAVSALFVITLSVGLLSHFTPYLKRKINDNTGIDLRERLWNASANIIRENLILGIGTGDVKDELEIKYSQKVLSEENPDIKDPHNQYIQLMIALGIIGLIMYLLCLSYLIYVSLSKGLFLLMAFTLLFALCGLTESNLSRQKGVVMFSFFVALLGNYSYYKQDKSQQNFS